MKIAWIINNINQPGGVERVVCNLSNIFTLKNHWNVEIVSLGSTESHIHFNLLEQVKVTHCSFKIEDFQNTKLTKRLRPVLQRIDADVVITCHAFISTAAVWNRSMIKGKLIVTQHGDCHIYSNKRLILNSLFLRFADSLVLLTESDAAIYKKFGLKNCRVIPNGIVEPCNLPAKVDNKIIVAAGSLIEIKGFRYLIEAFSMVHEKFPDWKLVIWGEGQQRKELENYISGKGLDSTVELPGFTDNIYEKFNESSVYVLSSISEGFCMTFLEAMSCGLPVICTDLPCVREAVQLHAGDVVPSKNAQALSEAICKMISSKEYRKECERNARLIAQEYTLDAINQRWIELIQSINSK